MLSNLLQSCSRVQQLLVRVIFLPGISDSGKPIRSPHVSLSKSTSRMRSGRFRRTESNSEAATTASSVLSGKLDADLRGKWLCTRQHNDIFGASD